MTPLHNSIIVGTWPISGDFGAVSLSAVERILQASYDAGFRTFDTAPNYGHGFSESTLGNVFAGQADVQIYTKFGNHPFIGKDFSVEALEASLAQSLQRLRRETIEGIFLHNPRKDITDYTELLGRLEALKTQGLVKSIGLSGAKGYDYSSVPWEKVDVYQQDVNLLYLNDLQEKHNVNTLFFARSPLATGILSGKFTVNTQFAQDDHRAAWLKGARLNSLVRRVQSIEAMLPPSLAIDSAARRFILFHDDIDSVVFGVSRPNHIESILMDIGAGPLPDEIVHALIDLHERGFGMPESEASLGY